MIQIKSLYKSFEDRTVLNDINFTFENGKICLLLNEKRQKGEKIESGEMTIRIKPVTMTVSMKGQYEGTETISTPAGVFDCGKVRRMKFLQRLTNV